MKILHIHPSMNGGGIESMICALANEMSRTEDVSVCSIFTPTEDTVFWHKLSPSVKKFNLGKTRPGFSVKEIFKIYNFIHRGHYDIVHIHGFFYYYVFAVFLLHRRVKFMYTIHSDAVKESSGWDYKFLPLKKLAFRKGFISPVTISKESKHSFTNLYNVGSTLIYNGVTPYERKATADTVAEYRITPQTKIFIHPGRISEAKNQVVLCEAFKTIIEAGKDVVLLIAGSRQDEAIWEKLRPFWCDRIKYLGERGDVRDLLHDADAFCLPSIWEGMPVTLLEAISVGCVPVCSPVGGIPEVITSGVNGFLSKDSSAESYVQALTEYLNYDNLAQVKVNCEETFRKFQISQVAEQYLSAYKAR